MRRRHFLLAAGALVLCATTPLAAQTAEEQVIAQLRRQGFDRIRVSRTMLGRVRILATGPRGEREIVLNPGTGTILRDHLERDRDDDDGSGRGRGRGRGGDDDDDDKGDKDDDKDGDRDDDDDSDDDGGDDGDDD